ncbi:hypothetical protein [Streptomyces vilmorinianum]|uniref:hypothetical protein n=1 Tax=Streptomyces vilmorinianum TaxID=3051092 RepID=UPI0010FB63E1|nr:hypothetical protein [Streptomyces vilmorinianum]
MWGNATEQYEAMFAACAAQPACQAAYPNLRAEFNATVQRLNRQPLTVTVPGEAGAPATTVVIDGYQLANVVVVAALPPFALTDVPAMVHALAAGDGLPAAKTILAGQSPTGCCPCRRNRSSSRGSSPTARHGTSDAPIPG